MSPRKQLNMFGEDGEEAEYAIPTFTDITDVKSPDLDPLVREFWKEQRFIISQTRKASRELTDDESEGTPLWRLRRMDEWIERMENRFRSGVLDDQTRTDLTDVLMFRARYGHLKYSATGSDTDAANEAYVVLYTTFEKVLRVMAKMAHVFDIRISSQYHSMNSAGPDGSIYSGQDHAWTLPSFLAARSLAARRSGMRGSETVSIAVTEDVESPTRRTSVWVKLPLSAREDSDSCSITLDYAIGGIHLGTDTLMVDGSGSIQSSGLSKGKALLEAGRVPRHLLTALQNSLRAHVDALSSSNESQDTVEAALSRTMTGINSLLSDTKSTTST